MMRPAKFWLGTTLALQIVLLVVVGVLAWYALNTNATLCDFKRDVQQRRDASAQYLQEIESGDRPLPAGLSLVDLRQAIAARDSTLRALSDLQCSQ